MTQVYLLKVFSYDPESGILRWKERPLEDFANVRSQGTVNTMRAGKIAGHKHYQKGGAPHALQVKVAQKPLTVHRVAWIMVHGDIPNGVHIDHKNGDPFDNRLCNLRLATPSQNSMNSKMSSTNTSGLKGVSASKWGFKASISVNGEAIHLGYHQTKGLAGLAYAKASIRHHGEFSRIR